MTVPRARVGLSTASAYPESTATAFEMARSASASVDTPESFENSV